MSPQVDILIPVYRVAPFIERCLLSVLSQTYNNMRIVLVEDASPDESIELAKQTIQNHNSHQHSVEISCRKENGGIGAVRADLLSHVTGKYTLFLDSDDYWDNGNIISEWVAVAEEGEYEVVLADYCHEYPAENRSKPISVNPSKGAKQLAYDYLKGTEGAYLWNKLFLSKVLLHYSSLTCAGRDLWEDLAITVPLLYHAERVGYYPRTTVHYLHHGSTQYTGGAQPTHIPILKGVLKDLDKELSDLKDNELHRALNSAKIRAFLVCCKLPFRYYKTIRKECIRPQDGQVPRQPFEWVKKLMYKLASNRYTAFLGYLAVHGAVKMKRILRYIV